MIKSSQERKKWTVSIAKEAAKKTGGLSHAEAQRRGEEGEQRR
jgi:hypothetical protein